MTVSEAGASDYLPASAPRGRRAADYDVTVRGAVSIARRLQDRSPSSSKSTRSPSAWGSTSTTFRRCAAPRPQRHRRDCVNARGPGYASVRCSRTWREGHRNRRTHHRLPHRRRLRGPPAAAERAATGRENLPPGGRDLFASVDGDRWTPPPCTRSPARSRRIITDAQRATAPLGCRRPGTSDGTDPLAGLNPPTTCGTATSQDSHMPRVRKAPPKHGRGHLRRAALTPAWTRAVASAPPALESVAFSRTYAPAWYSRAPSRTWRHSVRSWILACTRDGLVHISQMSRGCGEPTDIVRSGATSCRCVVRWRAAASLPCW